MPLVDGFGTPLGEVMTGVEPVGTPTRVLSTDLREVTIDGLTLLAGKALATCETTPPLNGLPVGKLLSVTFTSRVTLKDPAGTAGRLAILAPAVRSPVNSVPKPAEVGLGMLMTPDVMPTPTEATLCTDAPAPASRIVRAVRGVRLASDVGMESVDIDDSVGTEDNGVVGDCRLEMTGTELVLIEGTRDVELIVEGTRGAEIEGTCCAVVGTVKARMEEVVETDAST